jgi:hypothetical protein
MKTPKTLAKGVIQRAAEVFATELERQLEKGIDDILHKLSSPAGKQHLINFLAWNGRWVALLNERNARVAKDTYDFIDDHFGDALFYINQMSVLKDYEFQVRSQGNVVLDFGVHSGWSSRELARLFPDLTIHGFDSFEGLPEAWSHLPKGFFDTRGELPDVPRNVILHKGWFEDTLPQWTRRYPDVSIGLLRIDCDLYSSTVTILDNLGSYLREGSLLLFDELIGYRGWEHHEYRALQEFLARTGFGVKYHAYGLTYVLLELSSAE